MYILKNYMEDIVERALESVLQDYSGFCKCPKCILDIKAIALNNLPTKYGVTEIGKVFAEVDAMALQLQIDITNEILKSIDMVKKRPHDYRCEQFQK